MMNTPKENPFAGAMDTLRRALRLGLIQSNSRRTRPHLPSYTKAYADGRQKKGGALNKLEAKRVAVLRDHRQRPPPQMSAKARARKAKAQ